MIYGISTHLFAYEKLNKSHLDKISQSGINTIEIFANSHQIDFSNKAQLEEIEKGIRENNLNVNSVHAPFYFSLENLKNNGEVLDIASEDENFRKKSVEEITKSFILASLFQIDYFVLHFPDNANENILLKSVDQLLSISNTLGIKLTFENIPGNTTSLKHIKNFLEKNMIPIGICYDIGHSNMNYDVLSEIDEFGDTFYTTHIHDNDGKNDSHLMPFEGNINWKKVLKQFKKVDYKWGFILEVRKIDNNIDKTLKLISNTIEKFKNLENSL